MFNNWSSMIGDITLKKVAQYLEKRSGYSDIYSYRNGILTISELMPNEAKTIQEKLKEKGFESNYKYLSGSYLQYLHVPIVHSQMNKVKDIVEKYKRKSLSHF